MRVIPMVFGNQWSLLFLCLMSWRMMSLRKKGKRKKKQEEKTSITAKNFGASMSLSALKSAQNLVLAWRCRWLRLFPTCFFYIKISFGSASPKVFHRQILGVFDKFQSTSEKVFHAWRFINTGPGSLISFQNASQKDFSNVKIWISACW